MSKESVLLLKCLRFIIYNVKDIFLKDDFLNVNVDIFNRLLHYHKLDLLFYDKILQHLPVELQNNLKRNYLLKKDRRTKQLDALKEILGLLSQYDLLIVKGPHLASILYEEGELRSYNDIDILVKEKEVFNIAYKLINDLNFKFIIDPAGKKIEYDKLFYQYNSKFHEVRLYKDDIIVEIKRSTSALSESGINNTDFMFDNKFTQKIEGNILADVPNDNITFYHLLLNCYANTFCWYNMRRARLRDYYEIAVYIISKNNNLKWKDIWGISSHFKTNFKIFLVLRELNNVFDKIVTDDILYMFYEENQYTVEQCLEDFLLDVDARFFDVKTKLIRFNNFVKEFYYFSGKICDSKVANNKIGKFDLHIDSNLLKVKFILNPDEIMGEGKYRFSVWILDDEIVNNEYKPLFKMIYIYYDNDVIRAFYTENNEILLGGFEESDVYNNIENHNIPVNVINDSHSIMIKIEIETNNLLKNYNKHSKVFFRSTIEEQIIDDVYTIIENPNPILPGIPIVSMIQK